jgi:HEAT repeat protein
MRRPRLPARFFLMVVVTTLNGLAVARAEPPPNLVPNIRSLSSRIPAEKEAEIQRFVSRGNVGMRALMAAFQDQPSSQIRCLILDVIPRLGDQAERGLQELGPAAIDALLDCSADEMPVERTEVLRLLRAPIALRASQILTRHPGNDVSWNEVRAARLLEHVADDPSALPGLLACARLGIATSRYCARGLARSGSSEGVQALIGMLIENDHAVRKDARSALITLGERGLPYLREAFQRAGDRRLEPARLGQLRADIARVLAHVGESGQHVLLDFGEPGVLALLDAINEDDVRGHYDAPLDSVVVEALRHLAPTSTRVIEAELRRRGGPDEDAAACVARQLKDPALASALADALGAPSPITRRCAVLALGASGDVRFFDDVFDMALDRDDWVRRAGLDAVAMWGSTATPKLEQKLTSTGAGAIAARKASVRILVRLGVPGVEALRRHPAESAVTLFAVLMEDEQPARELLVAARNTAPDVILRRAVDALRDNGQRAAAARVIGQLAATEGTDANSPAFDPATALPALTDLLGPDAETTVAATAADALGAIRNPAAVSPLLAILDRPKLNLFLVEHVAAALGRIGDRRAVPALISLARDRKLDVIGRRAAAEALRHIGDPDGLEVAAHWESETGPTRLATLLGLAPLMAVILGAAAIVSRRAPGTTALRVTRWTSRCVLAAAGWLLAIAVVSGRMSGARDASEVTLGFALLAVLAMPCAFYAGRRTRAEGRRRWLLALGDALLATLVGFAFPWLLLAAVRLTR